jgi:hypothetical protein
LSLAFAHALATSVGVTIDRPGRDINGCDVLFRALDTPAADGAQLSAQLKCTVNRLARVNGGQELAFTLDQKDYQVEGPVQANWVEVRVLFGACREGPAWRGFFVSGPARLDGQVSWQRLRQLEARSPPTNPELRGVVIGLYRDASPQIRRSVASRCAYPDGKHEVQWRTRSITSSNSWA